MYSPSDENSSKRRKVRKGTHSCWECRRRKVKCTFESPQDEICITCHRRGAKCASQRDFDDTNLSKRPAEGKEPTDSLANTPTKSPGASRPAIRGASGICTPSISLSKSSTPAFSQHAGSVHSNGNGRQGEWPNQRRKASELQSTTSPNTHESITRELLRALPSENDIKILTGRITKAPLLCHQSFYKEGSQELLDEQCPLPNLLYPEEHPVLLASQMLLFSLAIQSWSPNDVPAGLSKHPHVIMEELAESAIKLVTTNDALLGTLESLENIMFEGMYHVDRGNIRRSWVTLRRAVTVAQLLGIHLPGHHRFKLIKTKSSLDPQAIWDCTVWMERLLSLLLGLPSCTLGMESAYQDTTSASTKSLELPPTLTDLIAKVLERNQVNTLEKSVELTREINKELIRIADFMPLRFWRPPAYDGMKANSQEAFAETKRILEHMRYYTLLNQLHLPHMLCPNTSFESTCSKIACVNASREILIRQIAIRNFNPISACLRMGDFMALIAGLTLVLAHIFSHCHEELANVLIHQRQSDRAIVEQALECMESMSELRNDVLSAKCSTLLKDLLAVEADAAQGGSYHAQTLQAGSGGGGNQNDCQVLVICVPYIGSIKIARRGNISVAPFERVSRDNIAREPVTLGGIGSVHLSNSALPSQNGIDSSLNQASRLPASNSADLSAQPSTTFDAEIIPGHILTQDEQMFPDAAAPLDDWVFQGFDTAFFDVLMRGISDPNQPSL
ncbi:unnamed protein product [Clonostachys byssicola]|uniref:Zn(2)-C6 fungal-type domain-containing protein n=1 Tax=Clonostachys byssicola TaxID=160290 RepID=A0A9N9U4Y3_9HYPO|nr:unnamed protein product [Clonostachys byssicola]